MKIGLIVIGKTDAGYFVEAINEYKNRLTHYIPFEMEVIPDIKNVKNLSEAQQKEKEGELILKALQPGDYLALPVRHIVLLTMRLSRSSMKCFRRWYRRS